MANQEKPISTTLKKREYVKHILENNRIVELIDNKGINDPSDLLGVNIFPFPKIDYTLQDASTYICMQINYPNLLDNDLYKNTVISFLVISHMSVILTPTGDSRVDLIAEELCKDFTWNQDIDIFRLQLVSDTEAPLTKDYYYRRLTFRTYANNNTSNGNRINKDKWL